MHRRDGDWAVTGVGPVSTTISTVRYEKRETFESGDA